MRRGQHDPRDPVHDHGTGREDGLVHEEVQRRNEDEEDEITRDQSDRQREDEESRADRRGGVGREENDAQ
ncbi:MAG: hypothetical protein ACOC06_00080 [Halorubrum sp.]